MLPSEKRYLVAQDFSVLIQRVVLFRDGFNALTATRSVHGVASLHVEKNGRNFPPKYVRSELISRRKLIFVDVRATWCNRRLETSREFAESPQTEFNFLFYRVYREGEAAVRLLVALLEIEEHLFPRGISFKSPRAAFRPQTGEIEAGKIFEPLLGMTAALV